MSKLDKKMFNIVYNACKCLEQELPQEEPAVTVPAPGRIAVTELHYSTEEVSHES